MEDITMEDIMEDINIKDNTYLLHLPADVLYDIAMNYLSLDGIINLCNNYEVFYRRYCHPIPSLEYHRPLWTKELFKRLVMSNPSKLNNGKTPISNKIITTLFEQVIYRMRGNNFNRDENLIWTYGNGYDVLEEYLLNTGASILNFLTILSNNPLSSRLRNCWKLDQAV